MCQGTIGFGGGPKKRTCSGPMVFIGFNLGILRDEKTHKYPLYRAYIGISHDGVRWARGPTSLPNSPECGGIFRSFVVSKVYGTRMSCRYLVTG